MRRWSTHFTAGAIVAGGAIASAYYAQGMIIIAKGGVGGGISSSGHNSWVGRTIEEVLACSLEEVEEHFNASIGVESSWSQE
eukprot:6613025-Ditylum_brightwellii.AAC.1